MKIYVDKKPELDNDLIFRLVQDNINIRLEVFDTKKNRLGIVAILRKEVFDNKVRLLLPGNLPEIGLHIDQFGRIIPENYSVSKNYHSRRK